TSTEEAPWYIIPADHKWATRAIVADIITSTLKGMNLQYPVLDEKQRESLRDSERILMNE
ncbi:MAG: polyphosphate kinase 2 family protein, partial [Phycisphaerae bacterium]